MGKAIIRKRQGGVKTIITNNQTGKENKTMINDAIDEKELIDIYTKKMNTFKNLSSGIVTIGKLNKGKQCIKMETFCKQDILNQAIVKILSHKGKDKTENENEKDIPKNAEHLINSKSKQAKIDIYRKESKGNQENEKFMLFNSSVAEIEANKLLDSNEKTGYKELIKFVMVQLKKTEKKLFNLYYLKGFTIREISKKIKLSKSDTGRLIKRLNTKLTRLKLKELFDTKFVSPDYAESMPAYPVFTPEIDCQDKGSHISIEDYESQESITYTPGYHEPNESYLALIDNDFICPTKDKQVYNDSLSQVIINDYAYCLEYKVEKYSTDSRGNRLNRNGCMDKFHSII